MTMTEISLTFTEHLEDGSTRQEQGTLVVTETARIWSIPAREIHVVKILSDLNFHPDDVRFSLMYVLCNPLTDVSAAIMETCIDHTVFMVNEERYVSCYSSYRALWDAVASRSYTHLGVYDPNPALKGWNATIRPEMRRVPDKYF